MKTITETHRSTLIQTIVTDFGDGAFDPGKYVFDQITRLPGCASQERMQAREAVGRVSAIHPLVILFDPHPENRRFALEVAHSAGVPNAPGFLASATDVGKLLLFDRCDMYVTSAAGRLLIVGCHEDPVVDGERIVWTCHWPEHMTESGDTNRY
jgi:hypothetical protein